MSDVSHVRRVAQERTLAGDQGRMQFLKLLNQHSTFEKGGTVQGADGKNLRLPATSQEAQQALRKAFEDMSPEEQEKCLEGAARLQEMTAQAQVSNTAQAQPPNSAPSNEGASSSGVSALGASSSRALGQSSSANEAQNNQQAPGMSPEQLQQLAEQYLNEQRAQGNSNEQIMNSLQAAYTNATDTVYGIATELQNINNARNQISEDVSELNVIIADGDYNPPVQFSYWDPETGQVVDPPVTLSSQAEAEALKETLETSKETLGNDAQMTQLELQQAMEQQAQTLQLMSTIMKMLHDTSMAIIRNVGG